MQKKEDTILLTRQCLPYSFSVASGIPAGLCQAQEGFFRLLRTVRHTDVPISRQVPFPV